MSPMRSRRPIQNHDVAIESNASHLVPNGSFGINCFVIPFLFDISGSPRSPATTAVSVCQHVCASGSESPLACAIKDLYQASQGPGCSGSSANVQRSVGGASRSSPKKFSLQRPLVDATF